MVTKIVHTYTCLSEVLLAHLGYSTAIPRLAALLKNTAISENALNENWSDWYLKNIVLTD